MTHKRQLFPTPQHTYVSYKNAKRVIDKLEDGEYSWIIATTEEGRFYPVIFLHGNTNLNFHYFLSKNCCVQVN